MKFFSKVPNFNFTAWRKLAMIVSTVLILASIVSFFTRGLNYGLDFTGGTLIEVGYPQPADLTKVREQLTTAGFEGAIVIHFGSSKDVLVRIAPQAELESAKIGDAVFTTLKEQEPLLDLRRQEYVGPQIGDELRDKGGIAMLLALGAILLYIVIRFEWRFALGSVAALVHDVVILVGIFSILQLDFDLTVLAAVLAVIGYSLNDTIVVFDRIRENFRKIRKGTSEKIVNTSLNQTLSRTLMTSITTLLVLLAMFFRGGELIHAFSTALIIGIIVGTYSSIYVASSIVLALKIDRSHMMPVQKEGADQQSHP